MKETPVESLPLRSLRRVRMLVRFFIFGLFMSGVTAIPLVYETGLLTQWIPMPVPADTSTLAGLARWIYLVRDGLADSRSKYPFLAYGTDWLAFGHFMIAVAFVGVWREPVRNAWLLSFGMIACVAVVPYALVFGQIRGIPLGWRFIDCAFGVVGFPLLWLARREIVRGGARG
jgi:hypothetical protein